MYDLFGTFADNLELNLDTMANKNPYLIVIPDDFNAKSSNIKTIKQHVKALKLMRITSQFGVQQLIQEPAHTLSNSFSCINQIKVLNQSIMSQPNLVMESGVHFSLHEKCHHQLVYAKFNLKVWSESVVSSTF